jgi:hypothetical protein
MRAGALATIAASFFSSAKLTGEATADWGEENIDVILSMSGLEELPVLARGEVALADRWEA